MKIELKNIGMLKKASVNLDGLTVIAGENDTGKTTVGKVIFCIIKAINRYEEDFQESREFKIKEQQDRIFFYLRRNISYDNIKNKTRQQYLDLFDILPFHENEIEKNDYLKELKSFVQSNNYEKEFTTKLNELIAELESTMSAPENKEESIQNALTKVFRSEFNSNILYYNEDNGHIKLYENDLLLLHVEINEKNKVSLKAVKPIEIKEATFIETPLILNNHDLLIRSQTGLDITKKNSARLGVPYTTLHTKDLFDKLRFMFFSNLDIDFDSIINKTILDTIKGKVIYDDEEKDFVYYMESGNKVSIKNTATGIKSFGIIQLLIDNGFIDRTSMLILDEPEIHLHPKWQLIYAQIICLLAQKGIPILVTSHSPYMIEALKRYSDKNEITKKTNFYLSSENVIENKDNLPAIFEKLSEPFEDFMNMDAEDLIDA